MNVTLTKQAKINISLWTAQTLGGHAPVQYHDIGRLGIPPEKEKDAKLHLNTLNWISQCFVVADKGDVVAASICSGQGKIVLRLCNNTANEGSKLKGLSEEFIKWNSELFAAYKTEAFSESRVEYRDRYLKSLADPCWKRISRKIELIGLINGTLLRTKETFDELFTYWKHQYFSPSLSFGGVTNIPDALADAAQVCFNDKIKVPEVIRKYFHDLVGMNLSMIDVAGRASYFLQALCRASYVLGSPFVKSIQIGNPDNSLRNSKDGDFAEKLTKRIRKIARYVLGADAYIAESLELFEGLSNTNGGQNDIPFFEVIWLTDKDYSNKGVRTEVEENLRVEDAKKWFNNELSEAKKATPEKDVEKDEISKARGSYENGIAKLKHAATMDKIKFANRLHCEIKMILHNETKGINADFNTIGVSKLMCWGCDAFISKMERERGKMFNIHGTSGKYHYQWLLPRAEIFPPPQPDRKAPPPERKPGPRIGYGGSPPHPLSKAVINSNEDVIQKLEKALRDTLKRRISTVGHFRQGSDSSTGSGWFLLERNNDWIPEFSQRTKDAVNGVKKK